MMPSQAEAGFYGELSPLLRSSGALQRGLDKAKMMAERGLDRVGTYKATRWFKGKDGEWRFELPDDQMGFSGRFVGTKRAADVVRNPDMFRAAPDVADIPVRYEGMKDGPAGYFTERGRNNAPEIVLNADGDPRYMSSVLLHELQHGIQSTQGLAPGGTGPQIAGYVLGPDVERGVKLLAQRERPGISGGLSRDDVRDLARAKTSANILLDPYAHDEFYDRSLGEAEARLTQHRHYMNQRSREESPPWEGYRSFRTQDRIPEGKLIVHPSPQTMSQLADVDRLMAYARKLKADGSP